MFRVILNVYQDSLGIEMLVILLDRLDKIITCLLQVTLCFVEIASVEIAQIGILGIKTQTLVNLALCSFPCARIFVALRPRGIIAGRVL